MVSFLLKFGNDIFHCISLLLSTCEYMFQGSSPASPDIVVRLLKEICSFPMIPIKLSVSKMNDNTSLGRK